MASICFQAVVSSFLSRLCVCHKYALDSDSDDEGSSEELHSGMPHRLTCAFPSHSLRLA